MIKNHGQRPLCAKMKSDALKRVALELHRELIGPRGISGGKGVLQGEGERGRVCLLLLKTRLQLVEQVRAELVHEIASFKQENTSNPAEHPLQVELFQEEIHKGCAG